MTLTLNSPCGLVIVAGHAIWNGLKWVGGFPGEDSFYAAHIKQGIEFLELHRYEYLAFSGGRTRPTLEVETRGLSEAESLRDFAVQCAMIKPDDRRVILESYARDSMENVFFSCLAFFHVTGTWPSKIGVVSWNSKALRFHLIAAGMYLGGRVFFHGVGDYPKQLDLERACAAEARFNAKLVDLDFAPPSYKLVDPLLRDNNEFAKKRWNRMPKSFTHDVAGNEDYISEVKAAYSGGDQRVLDLMDEVERLTPGDGWRDIGWPWR